MSPLTRPPNTAPRALLAALLACPAGCGDSAGASTEDTGSSSASTTDPATTGESTTSTGDDTTTAPTTGGSGTSTGDPGTTSTTADPTTGDSSSTGPVGCTRNVLLMGYWPPTNEMLRPWNTDPTQNPGGWIGANWGGHGYDVHSFFPEFPPDGDPTNDDIGDDGSVGSPDYPLRVDYQATSSDFWQLVDTYKPVILITTSRGGQLGWEIEALEGGHGMNNAGDPALDWSSDNYGADHRPFENTIEPRSWDAITTYRQGNTLPSQLPLDAILAATEPLGLTSVAINYGTSGNYLSGFLGLHGVYYNQIAAHNVAAGHIHVGYALPVVDAGALIEATLHAVLETHPADDVDCP